MMQPFRGPQAGKGPRLNAEMNVTPFVDVMLVLLIIFMIAAPLATVSIAVDLPQAGAAPQPQPSDPVYVSLQSDGSLYVGDAAVTLETLGGGLDAVAAARGYPAGGARIYLRADQDISYRRVMQVIGALQNAGYNNIGLVGKDDGEPAGK